MTTGFPDDLSQAFEAAQERVGRIERTISFWGREIRLSLAGPALVAPVLAPLAHLTVVPTGAPVGHICCWDSASTGVAPPPAPWSATDVGALGSVALPGASVLHHPGTSLSVHATGTGSAHWWTADARRLPWWERGAPLRALLHWLLAGHEQHLVHAAAVGVEGRGVLLAGPSGSGKSTLALACLRAGMDYAGDDYVLVDVGQAQVAAHSLYATAKLTPDLADRWPQLLAGYELLVAPPEEHVPVVAGGEKGVALIPPERMAKTVEVVAVVLPRLGPVERLAAASQGSAVRALAPSSILQLPGYAAGAMRAIAEVVRRVPAVELVLSGDPPAAADRVRHLLEELVGRPPSAS